VRVRATGAPRAHPLEVVRGVSSSSSSSSCRGALPRCLWRCHFRHWVERLCCCCAAADAGAIVLVPLVRPLVLVLVLLGVIRVSGVIAIARAVRIRLPIRDRFVRLASGWSGVGLGGAL